MKKIFSLIVGLIFLATFAKAEGKLTIEKQLVGIVGAISGTVKTETRTLNAGDKIYLNETIYAAENSGTQILLLDQSTFTIGSESEVVMDTFIYDPETSDGKIVASVKQGSLKVISGLISKKNPESLTVEVPEGTLGSRGTEFQTNVSKGKTDTLLIGPGKNNTLGLTPGAVLVGNNKGQTLLNKPYSVASMTKGKAPGKAKQITKSQLKKFNKKMKALKVAKASGATKEEKKAIRKKIKQELKAQGFEKEEIKTLIKDNLQKDKEKRIVLLNPDGQDTNDLDVDQSIGEAVEAPELEAAQPDVDVSDPEAKKNKDKVKDKKDKLPKEMIRIKTMTREDGSTVEIKQTINRKTGKFKQTQTITKLDGTVTTKEKKGKFKKKALNNLKKQEKASLKNKPENKKANKKKKPAKKKATKEKPKAKKKASKEKPAKKKAKPKAKKKDKPKAKKKAPAKKKAKPKAKAKAKPKKKAPKKAKPKKKAPKKKAKPKKKAPKKKAKPKKKKKVKKIVKKKKKKKKKKRTTKK